MSGIKHDAGKPRMDLLPPDPIRLIAEVLGFGAEPVERGGKGYGPNNWREGFDWSRLYGSVLRHIFSHMNGEDLDPESGKSHLAHAGCGILFLLEHEYRGLGRDDRYKHPSPITEAGRQQFADDCAKIVDEYVKHAKIEYVGPIKFGQCE